MRVQGKGRTGKGCFREYFGTPKWFPSAFRYAGAGILNVLGSKHYIGYGFDKKDKSWSSGVFLTDFEMSLTHWERKAAEADFIIHFSKPLGE
jgi:hypothetical protein